MAKEKPIEEGEIVESSELTVIENKAVNLTPSQMRAQVERDKQIREIVTSYIKQNLVEGKDFGKIEVSYQDKKTGEWKKSESKPTLLKPGSEKFCSLFKIRPVFRRDVETVEMLGNREGVVAYICELVDGKGQVVGEGRGVAVVDFSKGDFNVNKQVKLAEKRAQIDAILRTGGLSDFFTQDMEDAPREERSSGKSSEIARPASEAQKSYLRRLNKSYSQEDVDKLTATEASQKIQEEIEKVKNERN